MTAIRSDIQLATYNLSGALIEETYPSGRKVQNVLDNNGDLSIVKSKKNADAGYWNYASTFKYTAAGAVRSLKLGNGLTENTQYNNRLQPIQIALGRANDPTRLLQLDYEYGKLNGDCSTVLPATNNGNIAKQTITVRSSGQAQGFLARQCYTYDALNRIDLASESLYPDGGGSLQWLLQDFEYDRYGNRNFNEATTTTLPRNSAAGTICPQDRKIHNPAINTLNNQMSLADGYTFDAAGNMTADPQNRVFSYDAENKQVSVNIVAGQGFAAGTVGQYFYDGDGKRVKKITLENGQTVTTIFAYDAAGKLIAEYSTNVVSVEDAKVAYLTNDHLGSPRINTDRDGRVISRHDYHPFGEEIVTSQRTSNLEYTPDNVRKQFTGYERDDETGLDFAQARYLASGFGRFSSPDRPLLDQSSSDPQSWNLYVYAGNSPLKYVDPVGLWKQVDCEGGSTNCWEMEEGDTLESLAEKLGFSSENINEYFAGQELAEGRVFDMSGYAGWLKEQPDAMKRTVRDVAAGMPQFEPGGGGGIKIVGNLGRRSGFFGWLGRQAGRFGRWAGILSKPQVKTVADLAAKQLLGSSGKEMIRDAVNIVKSFKGSPQQKAELLEEFTKQITQRTGNQWSAYASAGADGSFIFTGEGRPFGIVIRLDGAIFKTDDIVRDAKIIGDKLLPLYDKLKQQ